MLNSDADKKKFELWLSTGLKKPAASGVNFTERILSQLEEQQSRQLLRRVCLQKKLYTGLTAALILSWVGLLFFRPVYTGIFTFLETLLGGLIQLAVEPTLGGLVIPAAVVILAVVVVWNLIDMVSLE